MASIINVHEPGRAKYLDANRAGCITDSPVRVESSRLSRPISDSVCATED